MSNIENHTPGPWKPIAQGDANEFCLLANDKRWVIAFRQNGELSTEEEKCNMKLIAKAPEMYRVLKEIRNIKDCGHHLRAYIDSVLE